MKPTLPVTPVSPQQSITSIKDTDYSDNQKTMQSPPNRLLQDLRSIPSIELVARNFGEFSIETGSKADVSSPSLNGGANSSFKPFLPSSVLQSLILFETKKVGVDGTKGSQSFDIPDTYADARELLMGDVHKIFNADPNGTEGFNTLITLRARHIPAEWRLRFMTSNSTKEPNMMALPRHPNTAWKTALIDALLTEPIDLQTGLGAGYTASQPRKMNEKMENAVREFANNWPIPDAAWTERAPELDALAHLVEGWRRAKDLKPMPALHTMLSTEQLERVRTALTPTEAGDFLACSVAATRWGFTKEEIDAKAAR